MELGIGALSTLAEGSGAEDLVAATPFADVRSDGVDHPGEVGTNDRRQTQARPGAVGAVSSVDRVNGGRMDSDPNLARARSRIRNVLNLQHLWAAKSADHNHTHARSA